MKTKLFFNLFNTLICILFCTQINAQQADALDFDGVDDQIDCGNDTSLQITGDNITLEVIIKFKSFKTNPFEGGIIVKESSDTGDNGYMLRVGSNGIINFNLGNGSWNELNTPQATVSLDTWYHITATYDGTTQIIYLNGTEVASQALDIDIANATTNLILGDWPFTNQDRNIDAVMDEVRIWNTTRTATEINDNLFTEISASSTGLVAYYTFNQGTANANNTAITALTDETGTNNGTLANFTLDGTTSNWVNSLGGVSYVNINATGANNGTSWSNAYTSLQVALDNITMAEDQIWVAAGTYLPTEAPDESTADTRDQAFHFNTNIHLYGGFAGTETAINQRTIGNETILSGDLGIPNDIADNTYHVLVTVNLTLDAIIDGFTITNGNANGSSNTMSYSNVNIIRTFGGGMFNGASSPNINNISFISNTANSGGGMVNNPDSSPNITNVSFIGNNANHNFAFGGGMFNNGTSPSLTNVSFSNNISNHKGGGMYNNFGAPNITNVSFSNNTASFGGGGMFNTNSNPSINNTVFYKNMRNNGTIDNIENSNSSPIGANNASDESNAPGITVDLSAITDPNTIFVNITNPAGADGIFGTPDDGLVPDRHISFKNKNYGWQHSHQTYCKTII